MINNWIRILLSIIFTNSNPIPTHYNYFSPSDRSEGGDRLGPFVSGLGPLSTVITSRSPPARYTGGRKRV